jgi:S1-C subfamily serine protease
LSIRGIQALVAAGLAWTLAAHADPYRTPLHANAASLDSLTFSGLVIRIPGDNEIAVEGGRLRVQFLESLRKNGYPALGAESLVFNEDKSNQARFVLGGTVNELKCRALNKGEKRCELGVSWELLDRKDDEVTYRVQARYAAAGRDSTTLADRLLWGTFYSLLSRPKFSAALKKHEPSASARPAFVKARYRGCARAAAPMPASADAMMQAAVVVRTQDELGSGAVISPDGLVLTAAHVIAGANQLWVQQRGGPKIQAEVIRSDNADDVALLRTQSGTDYPCIALRQTPVTVGDDVFAIGSPLGEELSFTLTRGVVSGLRNIGGEPFVQTDASINRGNSGGPLLDADGRLIGIVSWKVAGPDVQGLAFGVPVSAALKGLALEPSDATDPGLEQASQPTPVAKLAPVDDAADPMPSLVPPPPPRVPERPKAPRTRTARGLLVAGWITAGAGAAGVATTYFLYQNNQSSLTQTGFDRLRVGNNVGWAAFIVGAGLVLTGELLPRQKVESQKRSGIGPSLSATIGLGSVTLEARY